MRQPNLAVNSNLVVAARGLRLPQLAGWVDFSLPHRRIQTAVISSLFSGQWFKWDPFKFFLRALFSEIHVNPLILTLVKFNIV